MHPSNRREFLKNMGLGTAALTVPGLWPPHSAKDKKPNILFLFADDQRFDTLHALNRPEIRTPNLDRLLNKGVAFTHAHIMGGTSGAVCMPSRAMLLTGRTLFHLKDRGSTIPDDHALLPEILKKAGYKTFGTGKWHNGRKSYGRSFTHGGKIMFGGMSHHLKVPVYDFDHTGAYPRKKQYNAEKFSSELFTDEAIKFLKNQAGDDPFFMYVSYTAPHDPRMAPKAYQDIYPPEDLPLPENFMPEHPFDNGEMKIRDEKLAPWPRTPEIVRQHLAAYYAMITHLDAQIGRLLDALDETGKAKDTLIVFTSDNGLAVGSHGLLGKQNLYDHSVRVPLIFSGPGLPHGTTSSGLCYLLDLFPTLCEWLDLPVPETVEGKSLLPLIQGKKESIRSSLFLAYTHLHRGVRTEDGWKLIKYNVHGTKTTQLFDLNTDPFERLNKADDKKYAARIHALTDLLEKDMEELDDFCDLDQPNWGLSREINQKKNVKHLGLGKKIYLAQPYSTKYKGGGSSALIDGIRATSNFTDGSWQGFEGNDLEAIIDLGSMHPIEKITIGFLEDQESWIFLPLTVEFALSQKDKDFHTIKKRTLKKPGIQPHKIIKDFSEEFKKNLARYVRIRAKNMGRCPSWHQGAGGKAWLFTDEIIIE